MRGRSHSWLSRWTNALALSLLVLLWAAAVARSTVPAAFGLAGALALTLFVPRFQPSLDRAAGTMLILLAGLVIKDLWPIHPPFGAAIRALDPEGYPSPFAWHPRNPDLPAGALELGALALGVALALGLRHRVLDGQISARRIATTALAATWGFALLLLVAESARRDWVEWAPAVSSKNAAATLMAIGLVLQLDSLRHGLREAQGLRIGLGLIGLGLFVHGLATLNSGTGILAAAAGTLFYAVGWLAPDRRARWRVLSWSAIAIGCGATLLVVANANLTSRILSGGPSFRWEIWRDCLSLLATVPAFGVGCGAFAAVHPLHSQLNLSTDAYLAHPDSGYVMLLVEWGLVPSLVIAAALGRWLLRLSRSTLDPIDHALLAALAVLATAAITDPTFFRMPTFYLGCALAGTLAGRHPGHPGVGPIWLRRTWLPALGIVAAGSLVWGTNRWGDLRWRPLAAELQAKVGSEAWNRRPGDSVALAHLKASVELKRWSADFAAFAALHVHAASPIEAAPLWELALARGQAAGGVSLTRGRAAFPQTPAAYWADLALKANPDIALQLSDAEPIVTRRIAHEWLARRAASAPPQVWQTFIRFCTRAGQTEALRKAVPLLPAGNIALQASAGRALQTLGDLASAWGVLAKVFPLPAPPAGSEQASGLGSKTLIELGQFDELQRMTTQPGFKGPEAITVLKQVLLRSGASPWFRLRLAHAYADEQNWAEALALLPPPPAN